MSLSYKCIMLQRLYKRRLGEWGEVILLISIGGVRGCKLNCVKACRESLHSPLSTTRTCAQNLTSAIIRSRFDIVVIMSLLLYHFSNYILIIKIDNLFIIFSMLDFLLLFIIIIFVN